MRLDRALLRSDSAYLVVTTAPWLSSCCWKIDVGGHMTFLSTTMAKVWEYRALMITTTCFSARQFPATNVSCDDRKPADISCKLWISTSWYLIILDIFWIIVCRFVGLDRGFSHPIFIPIHMYDALGGALYSRTYRLSSDIMIPEEATLPEHVCTSTFGK